ncbi:hypothetical protein [Streptomyces arenae]|uniref:hypothetical protein n=1 Tax=Streptomyces arenae TaxID=29301 RepID=UPI00265A475E|nr:hypothetical protein [Streptomyces arenae]MCG7210589.1 hypothetical protein [Streptomyces arenae]
MGELLELAERVALLDACVEPIARRPVGLTDPDRVRRMREGPHPLDEAGIRPEAEAALRDVLTRYEEGDGGRTATLWAVVRRTTQSTTCGSRK